MCDPLLNKYKHVIMLHSSVIIWLDIAFKEVVCCCETREGNKYVAWFLPHYPSPPRQSIDSYPISLQHPDSRLIPTPLAFTTPPVDWFLPY